MHVSSAWVMPDITASGVWYTLLGRSVFGPSAIRFPLQELLLRVKNMRSRVSVLHRRCDKQAKCRTNVASQHQLCIEMAVKSIYDCGLLLQHSGVMHQLDQPLGPWHHKLALQWSILSSDASGDTSDNWRFIEAN